MRDFLVGFHTFTATVWQILAIVIVLAIGLGLLTIVVMYITDVRQKTHAIRRNYPVIGRFRYFFEHLGEFFRQYFFAMDREEMPFNRAERSWVYRAAKNLNNTVAFGSTRAINTTGSILFLNCPFPTLEEDSLEPQEITIGEFTARQPYKTREMFHISALSFGAISKPALRALSIGAKKAGIWLNTGEGGLTQYHLEGGCDVVFQIGTAKYGARTPDGQLSLEKLQEIAAHPQVKMFEIKMSQGAKPGRGGMLPAAKITPEVAAVRGIPVGKDSISPNGHTDIRSTEDLLKTIYRIREATGKPVGFKIVVGSYAWLDELFAAVYRLGLNHAPDFITIDSCDGGTGAAPQSLMDFVGLPLKESLPLVIDKLNEYGLRPYVKVIASGKLITPSGVAWALSMGADFATSGRGFMFALGCIQALLCNKNSCPTGITTHRADLQKGLDPALKSERVASYARNMTHEIGEIAHSCGVQQPRQLKRHHAHMVMENGLSQALNDVYPDAQTRPEFQQVKWMSTKG
jgi:glutamate synthase domain-containing protein 2